MPILKSEVRNKYTTIPNSVIQNCELSDGDFRLLIFLYSLPDGWKINQGYLGQKLGCSRININKKIRRIKESGYLEILKAKDSNTDYIYVLKEKDVSVNDVSLRDVSSRDVSLSDTHINNNIINTDNINNKNNMSLLEITKKIIEHLNTKTGSKFKHSSKATQLKINARLNEGYKLDDFIVVIDKKYEEWHDTEFEQYLCPETLFGTKFEKYLNQKIIKRAQCQNKKAPPEWLDKKIEKEEVSDDEAKELEELLKGV